MPSTGVRRAYINREGVKYNQKKRKENSNTHKGDNKTTTNKKQHQRNHQSNDSDTTLKATRNKLSSRMREEVSVASPPRRERHPQVPQTPIRESRFFNSNFYRDRGLTAMPPMRGMTPKVSLLPPKAKA
jgi:hypothetical protein